MKSIIYNVNTSTGELTPIALNQPGQVRNDGASCGFSAPFCPNEIQYTAVASCPTTGAGIITYTITINITDAGSLSAPFTVTVNGVEQTTNAMLNTRVVVNNVMGDATVQVSTASFCFECTSVEAVTAADCVPVELLSFTAKPLEEQIELEWRTASELNNEYFQIERSADGKTFYSIGKIAGNGTTVEMNDYLFIDEEPLKDMNYYRLKQVDFSSYYDYSHIIQAALDNKVFSAILSPVPAQEELNISATETIAKIEVFDMYGKLVKQHIADASQVRLNIDMLNIGTYFVRLQNEHGKVSVKRFVKH